MRAPAIRPRRLALACALISAATLGTVTASAASASDASSARTSTTDAAPLNAWTTGGSGVSRGGPASEGAKPPEGAGLAVAYRPTANAPDDVNTANDRFAACMREEGQKHYPDFHASKDDAGHIRLNVKVTGKDFDPTSDAYQDALDSCAPILAKAGITFPDPADLPPLPEKPGKHEAPSLHKQKLPGTPGKPDLSSTAGTSTSTKNA
ncbi:hypothetical protein [Streptomyces sp. NPDC058371]|uniref:hypothetical protein n=1 Tax=Streptomyces sp. NPDC058371 TaxID=3346463 RepID=UPI0036673B5E